MTTMPQDSNMTDLLIIGGGPAGMFVAFTAECAKLR